MSPKEEAFVEPRPQSEGFNLRHWRGTQHVTGQDCPCLPEFIPQTGEPSTGDEPAIVIDDREHECVFVEEQEPSGRLILPPCIKCGFSAMDALDQLREGQA